MKSIFTILIVVFSFVYTQAQFLAFNSFYPQIPDSSFSCLTIQSSYGTQCNSFSGQFIKAIKNSSFISNDIKNTNSIKKNNFAGYEWANNISYYTQPDSLFGMENTGLHVGISYQQFFSMRATKDVYQLIAFGNKDFEGQHISLKNNQYQYYNYGTFTLGIFKKFTAGKLSANALFDVNFHLFKDIQNLYVTDGDIFTAEDGTSFDIAAKARYQGTPSGNNFEIPGLSFNALIHVTDKSSNLTFTFQINQLGSVFLNKKSYHAYLDTSIHFDGVALNQVLSSPSYQAGILSQDSLKKLYKSHVDTMPSTLMLPEIIHFSMVKKWENPLLQLSEVGVSYIFHVGQTIPTVYALQTFSVTKQLALGIGVRYGGFSFIDSYFTAEFNIKKSISILIVANDIISFADKKYPYNYNFQFAVRKYW